MERTKKPVRYFPCSELVFYRISLINNQQKNVYIVPWYVALSDYYFQFVRTSNVIHILVPHFPVLLRD